MAIGGGRGGGEILELDSLRGGEILELDSLRDGEVSGVDDTETTARVFCDVHVLPVYKSIISSTFLVNSIIFNIISSMSLDSFIIFSDCSLLSLKLCI